MTSGEMRLDATFVSRPERGEIGGTTAQQMTKKRIKSTLGSKARLCTPFPGAEGRVFLRFFFTFQTGFSRLERWGQTFPSSTPPLPFLIPRIACGFLTPQFSPLGHS